MVSKNYLVKSKRKKILNTILNSFLDDHIATKKPNLTNEQKIAFQEFQTMKPGDVLPVSYTHLTLPTNQCV